MPQVDWVAAEHLLSPFSSPFFEVILLYDMGSGYCFRQFFWLTFIMHSFHFRNWFINLLLFRWFLPIQTRQVFQHFCKTYFLLSIKLSFCVYSLNCNCQIGTRTYVLRSRFWCFGYLSNRFLPFMWNCTFILSGENEGCFCMSQVEG